MDLSNDELENCVEKFRNVFLKYGNNRKNENDLLALIENLSEELNITRENEEKWKNKVKCFTDCPNTELNKKYVILEEKFRKLKEENEELVTKYADLNSEMNTKLELQKNEYLQKIETNLEISNLEVANLKNQIESDKICYESKEKELYNELQVVQAANAIQYDELESNLKRQLVDVNSKLRQAQNTIRSLQLELNNLKTQQRYNAQKNNVLHFQSTPIQVIKNNTGFYRHSANLDYFADGNAEENVSHDHFYEQDSGKAMRECDSVRPASTMTECSSVTKITQGDSQKRQLNSAYDMSKISPRSSSTCSESAKMLQNEKENATNYAATLSRNRINSMQNEKHNFQSSFCDKQQRKNIDNNAHKNQSQKQIDTSTKYPPLPLNKVLSFEESDKYEDFSKNKPQSAAPVLHRGSSSTIRRKNNVPPLMPCNNNNKGKPKQKKRKLYNPDDFLYSEDLEDK